MLMPAFDVHEFSLVYISDTKINQMMLQYLTNEIKETNTSNVWRVIIYA